MKIYRETEFQETELGKIPKDWRVGELGEVLVLGHGKRPDAILPEGEFPVYGGGGFYGYTNTYLVDKPYVLIIARVGAGSAGKGKVYLSRGKVWVTDNAIYGYSREPNSIITVYVYYWLLFERSWIKRYVSRAAGGSAVITLNSLKNIILPLPPPDEQKNIVEILLTVDNAIESIDRAVARLERLKKALMDKLLTGRIRVREEDGKLKLYRETEFQEAEMGKIPRDWKMLRLKDIAEIRGSKKVSQSNDKVVFIPMEAIPDNDLYVKFELQDIDKVRSYVYCEPGDILLAKITPSFENGKQGIVPTNIPGKFALATTEAYPIKCKNINAFFLFYLLKYPPVRNRLVSLMRGTTGRKRVPREALENLLLPYPPIDEQRSITEIILTIDEVIKLSCRERDSLEHLKRGLMKLLLTGKVRVRA